MFEVWLKMVNGTMFLWSCWLRLELAIEDAVDLQARGLGEAWVKI